MALDRAFQFTPLREGRPGRRRCTPQSPRYFNSRPSARGDLVASSVLRRLVHFNSRPSARGDHLHRRDAHRHEEISIHAPPRGATSRFSNAIRLASQFQFTPLREGRLAASESPGVGKISIHAPPRGATRRALPVGGDPHISIHAPPRGATYQDAYDRGWKYISIHAPPRGATSGAWRESCTAWNFNSRPSARGDARGSASRLRRTNFNSRPSARGDGRCSAPSPAQTCISIHAPPRGATCSFFAPADATFISIHAPPRGATAKDMQFLQIFCSTLTNQHGLTIVPRNLSRLFW